MTTNLNAAKGYFPAITFLSLSSYQNQGKNSHTLDCIHSLQVRVSHGEMLELVILRFDLSYIYQFECKHHYIFMNEILL